MTREEAKEILTHNWTRVDNPNYSESELDEAFFMAIEALSAKPTISMFAESEEAYKAWTGEEMGKTGDEINEMNKEIIKDILKMMPTAYLLEALGVSTFEELTEQADRPTMTEEVREALQILKCERWYMSRYSEEYKEAYDMAIEALSAQADRPHGEWEDGKWCSICGCGIPTDVWGGGLSEEEAHYCVNCGALMGGDRE